MSTETFTMILTIGIPAIAGILGGVGFAAFMNYVSNRPINIAKARRENISGELEVGEAWQKYATSVNTQYENLQKQYKDIQGMYDDLRKKHEEIIKLKDEEITKLKAKNTELENELVHLRAIPRGQ